MRTRPRATSRDLSLAITCLPRHTREAMLEGIRGTDIIVGAYATRDGICPMLAAHRNGGRTNFISFANAWDRFAFRNGPGRARRATDRELRVLCAHLEASLLDEDAPHGDLAAARREHEQLLAARREHEQLLAERDRLNDHRDQLAAGRTPAQPSRDRRQTRDARPQDADRQRELDSRPGWAWTRLVRRYDDYERLLEHVDAAVGPDRRRRCVDGRPSSGGRDRLKLQQRFVDQLAKGGRVILCHPAGEGHVEHRYARLRSEDSRVG